MKVKRIPLIGGGIAVAALLVGVMIGVPAFIDANRPAPVVEAVVPAMPRYVVSGFTHPTPTPTPSPSAVEEAPLVETPVVDEAPPESAGPVLCPPGSMANSSDGYNDTSCYPEICFNISVPDPAHPECDYAFEP